MEVEGREGGERERLGTRREEEEGGRERRKEGGKEGGREEKGRVKREGSKHMPD